MLYPIQNQFRNKLDMSGIWDFQPDPQEIGVTQGWYNGLPAPRPIAVPGSWNEQYTDLFNYFDLGWYLLRANVPQSWQGQRVFLRIGSANYFARLYLNGVEVGSHEGGHLPFAFEISDLLRWHEPNVIAISVENSLKPARVPSANLGGGIETDSITSGYPSTTFDFFPYAGLHRLVALYSTPQTFIEDLSVVTDIHGEQGVVQVQAKINAAQGAGKAILSGGDQRIEAQLQFENGQAEASLVVPHARQWSDRDPYLYDLTVLLDGDCYTLKVGIRTVVVQGRQILLNGKPVQLNGFGRHEDFYASGRGLNLPLLVKDYQLMRWTGANSYRTSHYPYSEEEMMLADREGFLIIDEIPAVSLHFDTPANIAERLRMCLQQIDEMIARDKNHPSVVMWSVANEPMPPKLISRFTSQEDAKDPLMQAGKDFLDRLIRHARQLDPTRPVTHVSRMAAPLDWQEECDVVCMNRYWGWYVQGGELDKAFTALDQELDAAWEMLGKPIIVSEFGADTQAGLHGHPSVMWTEEYQAEMLRGYLEVGARKDFVVGMQVWNFADFAAVQSIIRVGGMNLKGVFTRARQPKMAAHVLREFWTRDAPSPLAPERKSGVRPVREQAQSEAPIDQQYDPLAVNAGVQDLLAGLVRRMNERKPDLTTTLKFDFFDEGIYRVVFESGACRLMQGDGPAAAAMQLKWTDAQKLFRGELNPMVAILTGKIKTQGDARAFVMLQEFLN